jgi:hypothetical protein
MFRPISGHPEVHSWSLKHIKEEPDLYIMYIRTYIMYIFSFICFKDQLWTGGWNM